MGLTIHDMEDLKSSRHKGWHDVHANNDKSSPVVSIAGWIVFGAAIFERVRRSSGIGSVFITGKEPEWPRHPADWQPKDPGESGPEYRKQCLRRAKETDNLGLC